MYTGTSFPSTNLLVTRFPTKCCCHTRTVGKPKKNSRAQNSSRVDIIDNINLYAHPFYMCRCGCHNTIYGGIQHSRTVRSYSDWVTVTRTRSTSVRRRCRLADLNIDGIHPLTSVLNRWHVELNTNKGTLTPTRYLQSKSLQQSHRIRARSGIIQRHVLALCKYIHIACMHVMYVHMQCKYSSRLHVACIWYTGYRQTWQSIA